MNVLRLHYFPIAATITCMFFASCSKQEPAMTVEQIREQLVGSWHESGGREEIVAFDASGQVTAWGSVVHEAGRISWMTIGETQLSGISTLVIRESSGIAHLEPDGLVIVTDARPRKQQVSYEIDT